MHTRCVSIRCCYSCGVIAAKPCVVICSGGVVTRLCMRGICLAGHTFHSLPLFCVYLQPNVRAPLGVVLLTFGSWQCHDRLLSRCYWCYFDIAAILTLQLLCMLAITATVVNSGCIEELVDCSGGDDISLESGTQRKLDALMEALDRVKYVSHHACRS